MTVMKFQFITKCQNSSKNIFFVCYSNDRKNNVENARTKIWYMIVHAYKSKSIILSGWLTIGLDIHCISFLFRFKLILSNLTEQNEMIEIRRSCFNMLKCIKMIQFIENDRFPTIIRDTNCCVENTKKLTKLWRKRFNTCIRAYTLEMQSNRVNKPKLCGTSNWLVEIYGSTLGCINVSDFICDIISTKVNRNQRDNSKYIEN